MLFSTRQDMAQFQEEAYFEKTNTFVSINTPLLSNLCMLENISLVLQVHQGLTRKQANEEAYTALSALGIEEIALLRYEAFSEKVIFLVQIIRACIQKDAKIILVQPFSFLGSETDLDFIFDTLGTLHVSWDRVLIIDLMHQKSYYQESRCHIIK